MENGDHHKWKQNALGNLGINDKLIAGEIYKPYTYVTYKYNMI